MGFLFRLCFWLGVTLAIMPPDERPGEALAGVPGELNLEERFLSTVQSVVALAANVSTACDDNPDLCAATAALAQTAAITGQTLITDAKAGLSQSAKPTEPSARLEQPTVEPNTDGRVGRGQAPAG